ncbi:hypothetical protein [Natronosalvus rutilus]|uniref:Uncharacterized protein n=1 Tax=Natronosalvus rutilus TaxID=2953753 RepID=A0A9E7NFE4_9EURY|nr:hypothetical protein [Natronosalvus rutilus]UTF56018.1 hypothetical protein NGM29_20745 [Natronosalvus rutilus]
MRRYNPTEGDLLIETVYGRKRTHVITDVDAGSVTYERPDGVQVTALATALRRDLTRGRFAVSRPEPEEAR